MSFSEALSKFTAALNGVIPLVELNGSGVLTNLRGDASGNLLVTLSALASGAATAALQTTLNALVTTPTIPTQITASDDTDVSAVTAKGLIVETAGDLAVRGTGAPSTTVTITVAAGQYVPIQCSRVMAASSAVVVGLS